MHCWNWVVLLLLWLLGLLHPHVVTLKSITSAINNCFLKVKKPLTCSRVSVPAGVSSQQSFSPKQWCIQWHIQPWCRQIHRHSVSRWSPQLAAVINNPVVKVNMVLDVHRSPNPVVKVNMVLDVHRNPNPGVKSKHGAWCPQKPKPMGKMNTYMY